MMGRIHSIESFSTVDGPGIRTVVFFQGCPLSCQYCQNVDTRAFDSPLAKNIDSSEILKKFIKFKPYYKDNGGITVSGGEPTSQPEFLGEVLKLCKENGIHTALDTSGFLDISKTHLYLPYTDLVLLDIKHLDCDRCSVLTGKGNESTVTFLNHLQKINIPVILRQVVIPGITDSADYILSLGKFASSFTVIKKVELLPYHKLGDKKWDSLCLTQPLKDVLPMSVEKTSGLQALLDEALNKN